MHVAVLNNSTKTVTLFYYLFPGKGLMHAIMIEIRSFILL